MKKILIILVFMATAEAGNLFVEYTQTIENAEEMYIYDIQPLSELVGNGGTRHEITIGEKATKNFSYGVGIGYVPDESQWDTSLKMKLQTDTQSGLNCFLGTKVGMGIQTGDNEKDISTNVTKLSFVTSSNVDAYKTPSTAEFVEDPLFLELGVSVGASYTVMKNLDVFVAYEYQAKYWQIDYRVKENPSIHNSLVETQRLNNFSFGLTYLF